ncbi:prepilin peptidase [Prosthecochloris sp. N3]|uniref:Prepilin peptidase n=1 Tax=Prosthecochloris ethylica TaxID=2743976 RepID=A0ABR9XQA6_9CHLB|nr:A24 family peptidase [Prosthecochloris ethylica]MBF0586289.1 prepilin peptidase [Prosthecochloris ethylica]MBF0635995.1 prepilin peptidase [Prosthecochloris ethylica]NUK47330.1 prepilin peptidase [Prosthecochloris ethylica]
MNISNVFHLLSAHWPWGLSGALAGIWLVPLARTIPQYVLHSARAPREEWLGPGGGLEQPVPRARRIWLPAVNAMLWVYIASTTGNPAFWNTLTTAAVSSLLVLLALIDWDTTLLPDWIVLPLGIAGLVGSYAGFTPHNLPAGAASAVVVMGLLGGLSRVFKRIRGESGIGGGDIKLLAGLATWWGVVSILHVVLLASVMTVVWYLLWLRFKGMNRQAEWPFGPAIVIAALAWCL